MAKQSSEKIFASEIALVLDIGCGTGELTYDLARKVSSTGKVFALEPDTARLKVAIDNQSSYLRNIQWYPSTIELSDELPTKSIDIVYSNYVLHWVSDKKKAIVQINCFMPLYKMNFMEKEWELFFVVVISISVLSVVIVIFEKFVK